MKTYKHIFEELLKEENITLIKNSITRLLKSGRNWAALTIQFDTRTTLLRSEETKRNFTD